MNDVICPKGCIDIEIEHRSGKKETVFHKNTVLRNGRIALASGLANVIGNSFQFYITRMLFGDEGTTSGVPKYVNADRNGLFGPTLLSKPIISSLDASIPTQAIFTSVVTFDELVGVNISEIALQMATADLYSMATFPDLGKTSDIQITFNWSLSFV